MSGKSLLAKLLGTASVATAPAIAVAAGSPELSADVQAAGTAQMESLVEAAHLEGQNEGRRMERERFGAVLTHEATDGRLGLAITLLSTTDNSHDQIVACLGASPKAATPTPAAPTAPAPAQVVHQQVAGDPLASGGVDSIAANMPLIDTGNPSGNAADTDNVDVASIWGPAIDSVAASVGVASNGFSANGLRAN